jgi:hypothetical protein
VEIFLYNSSILHANFFACKQIHNLKNIKFIMMNKFTKLNNLLLFHSILIKLNKIKFHKNFLCLIILRLSHLIEKGNHEKIY